MPISVVCPACAAKLKAPDGAAGKRVKCPKCATTLNLPASSAPSAVPDWLEQAHEGPQKDSQPQRQPAEGQVEALGANVPSYPLLRRELLLIDLRQRPRALCDAVRLGPSTGERLCCALIVGVVPFAISFALSFAYREPAGYAALQGVAAFAIVATFCSVLVTVGSDEALEARRKQLILALPAAATAWREQQDRERSERAARKEQERLDRAAGQERARLMREAAQQEQAPWQEEEARRVPAEIGPPTSVVHVHVHAPAPRKSGGVAAVLEVIFGLFFQAFGIGHMYAGNVGTGLLLLFGYWLFVAVNVVLCFFTCGIWIPVACVVVPACWFILMIVSPLTAAGAARYR